MTIGDFPKTGSLELKAGCFPKINHITLMLKSIKHNINVTDLKKKLTLKTLIYDIYELLFSLLLL